MRRPRVSILGMMVVVVAAATAFAALRTASDLWFSAIYTLTTVLLLGAVIAARFRRGEGRAFWFGFAVFGWGFFFLGLGGWPHPMEEPKEGMVGSLNRNLITARAILFLVPRLRPETDDVEAVSTITANTTGIAYLLVTLALACCGGLFAAWMRGRRRARVSPPLIVLAALGLTSAYALSGEFAPPPTRFFPDAVIKEDEGLNAFEVEWYSKHLEAMGEAPLWSGPRPEGAVAYRLLWLPSFHHPICVRAERSGGVARLRARVLDGLGGYEPGQLAIERTIALDDVEWRALEGLLDAAHYWAMPTKLKDDGGSDGDQVIVEGVDGGRYHLVDRWEPDPAYAALARAMLEMTGLKVGVWDEYHGRDDPGAAVPSPQ